jgi:hypothetical protein
MATVLILVGSPRRAATPLCSQTRSGRVSRQAAARQRSAISMTTSPTSCGIAAVAGGRTGNAASRMDTAPFSSMTSCLRRRSSSARRSTGTACRRRPRPSSTAASATMRPPIPLRTEVVARMQGKRLGLVLASEETYPGAELGIVHQIQEFSRYTRSRFVGCVKGCRQFPRARSQRIQMIRSRRQGGSAPSIFSRKLFRLSSGYTAQCPRLGIAGTQQEPP